MKKLLPVILICFLGYRLLAQTAVDTREGTISFITSQNVYVKFESTETISAGDTLFANESGKMIPVLIVKDLSSISCVCVPITTRKLSLADKISAKPKAIPTKSPAESPVTPVVPVFVKAETDTLKKEISNQVKQDINGRVSISSYSDFSNVSDFSQRLRYTFSLDAQNMGNSKLSGEAYISFAHKINQWSEIQNNFHNGLKVYSLACTYAFDKKNTVWAGRKINPKLSSVGAIDGIQYEHKFKAVSAGLFAGSRPDYMDYSFNPNLLQFGGYFGHDYISEKGSMQTSLAFIEQMNHGNTDRRFAYLQHSNSLLPKLNFFGSVEFDFYNKVRNTQDSTLNKDNKPKLTNVYVSLRYKIIKQVSLSLSYSARQNIIYYETYKNIIDQLLEAATLQGYMFQVSYRPGKNISAGANAGYRFSKQDPRASKNLYAYFTYSNVPWLKASATISATLFETGYMNGSIYSLALTRDLIPGKLDGEIGYRYVDYHFVTSESPLVQNMAEMNLTWRVIKKLSLSLNFEGTFEKQNNYQRVYVNLTKRF